MTTTTNNRFQTTTFGNDNKSKRHPREFFVGDIAVTQENKNGKTQIPIPCGSHPIAGGLFFGNDGKKCRFCRWFFAVYRRGLTPFFFLVNFDKQRVCKGGRVWRLKAAKKGVFARSFCPSSNKTESHGAYATLSVRPLF